MIGHNGILIDLFVQDLLSHEFDRLGVNGDFNGLTN